MKTSMNFHSLPNLGAKRGASSFPALARPGEKKTAAGKLLRRWGERCDFFKTDWGGISEEHVVSFLIILRIFRLMHSLLWMFFLPHCKHKDENSCWVDMNVYLSQQTPFVRKNLTAFFECQTWDGSVSRWHIRQQNTAQLDQCILFANLGILRWNHLGIRFEWFKQKDLQRNDPKWRVSACR